MRMIGIVAWRELRNLFVTPLGWTVLVLVQAIQGLLFYRLTQAYLNAPVITGAKAGITYNIAALSLGTSGYIALLVVPLLTMNLISGERQRATLPLLLSSPVSGLQVVLGKYLGVLGFLAVLLAMLTAMPLFLLIGTPLDMGLLASALLGTFLLLAAYAALGLYMSALAPRPALAALGTVVVLLLLWVVELLASTGIDAMDATLAYLSAFQHLEPMLRGAVDSRDLAYFLLAIFAFVSLSALHLERLRLRN